MTEADWHACRNPWNMLPHLGQRASDRKSRLLICACCRLCLDALPNDELLQVLDWAEQNLDRPFSPEQADLAQRTFREVLTGLTPTTGYIAEAIYPLVFGEPVVSVGLSVDFFVEALREEELGEFEQNLHRAGQCLLIREIFGNPYRPLQVEPAWQTSDVLGLAQAIYATQDYERLPILADALEDAGCVDGEILRHCRHEGRHVRGCWVVDGVLGKE